MTPRAHFELVLNGQKPANMPFVPDIVTWYIDKRTPAGEAHKYGPGEFVPDDDPIHRVAGTMPDKYRDFTLLDFYRQFGWGYHVHYESWHKDTYAGGISHSTYKEGTGKQFHVFKTPKGDLREMFLLSSDGSWTRKEFLIKDLHRDLPILKYIVENTSYTPTPENVQAIMDQLGELGQGDLVIARSPFGKAVHNYIGFENTIYAMMDNEDLMRDFLAVQEIKDHELIDCLPTIPEKLVILSDHADENLISPRQWEEECIPFYRAIADKIHGMGKSLSTHLDGNFKGFFPLLGKCGFDMLDGCTPAPMFNYEVEELAEAMPDGMTAFVGVPSTLFCQNLPTAEILRFADRIINAFQGRAIINVGDVLPPNGDIEQVIALGDHVRNSWS